MSEIETRAETDYEKWLKLTFRLTVGDHWEKVSAWIIAGDVTYRWCREMIRSSLAGLEHSANKLLSAAIVNIKSELWQLRGNGFEESRSPFAGFSVWENTFEMAYDLTRSLTAVSDRLSALKLAIVAGTFRSCKDREFLTLKTKIFRVFFSLQDVNESADASRDINEAFYSFVDFLRELEVDTTEEEMERIGERTPGRGVDSWKAPEFWCFGDFGNREGQMEYPVDVLVDDQGSFLVLEQDSKGRETTQRIQLFDNNGRYQKTLLQRGRDGVASMHGMALDSAGNLVVTLKDEQGIGRVNVYNMQGTRVQVINVLIPNPKFPPFFTSVAVDKEGRILVVEHHEMAVQIYAKDGTFVAEFGQGGRTAQPGVFENISSLNISPQTNEVFVCDPLRSVQVFNSKGEFVRFFKSDGAVIPTHVVVSDNEVYGVNRDAHALEVYSPDGTVTRRKAGGFGGELGRLWTPLGIARTSGGSIAVAEKESHRIQVFNI